MQRLLVRRIRGSIVAEQSLASAISPVTAQKRALHPVIVARRPIHEQAIFKTARFSEQWTFPLLTFRSDAYNPKRRLDAG